MSTESPPPVSNPPPPIPNRWPQRIVLVLLVAVVLPIGMSVLYANPPTERVGIVRFFPTCTFYDLTGLHCPGCGVTRALHSLLHAELAQAFAWNPLFVIFAPFLLFALARMGYSAWTGRKAPGPTLPRRGAIVILVVLISYWIARNIPIDPVNPLAPHRLAPSDPPEPPPAPMP